MTTVEAEAPQAPETETTLTASSVDEARRLFLLEVIDKAVRAARNGGWCDQFERSMRLIFPDGHPDNADGHVNPWVDSDGLDCRGYDREGFREGFDANGYDREGYNQSGLHRVTGLTRDGFNRYGFDADGYGRDGFNQAGINRDEVDRAGNRVGTPEHEDWLYRFDQRGYDADGFSARGLHEVSGLSRVEHARRFRFNADFVERPAR